jgi:tetrapyrrole methylase family protein/MazG family protein
MAASEERGTSFEALRAIMARLRGPGGCPWDQEQTHASLRRSLLEECYEALDALDRGDPLALREELGDILVQVAFHCQIAAEKGEFTDAELFRQVIEKLVRRHPHVFGDAQVRDAREVEEQWEAIKQVERQGRSLLDGVPQATPALTYAQAISHRAARSGFEWKDLAGVMAKVREELAELEEAQGLKEQEHELGDLLFTLVNVARWLGLDAESALRTANQRFYRRFTAMEEASRRQGASFTELPMDAKEALWEDAKAQEGGGEPSPPAP